MPNDPGATSWNADEYHRALSHIDQAGTKHAATLNRAKVRVRVERGGTPTIRVPGWDDIVRVGPRPIVTPEDRAIQRDFERRGLPSPLAPEQQGEIQKRRELAQHIQNSPIPEYQQSTAATLTAVDNVNDAAVTAMVASRASVGILGRFGTWLAPAVLALGKIASLTNILGWALQGLGMAYALACGGPRALAAQYSGVALANAAFAGVRAVLPRRRGIRHPNPGQAQKGRMAAAMMGSPEGRALTNTRTSRWAKIRPSFAEALQVAQTTYDVTGYGLSLGALYGFTAETTYTATRASRGEPVRPRSPRVNHALQRILAPHVEILSNAALWHREQCARAVASAPIILRDPETFGAELYALTWLTYYVSLEPLMWDVQGISWRETVMENLPAAWTPWDPRDPVTRDALADLGVDLEAPMRWPLPGAPLELTSVQLVEEIGPEIGRALRRFLHQDETDPLRRFVAEVSVRVCERVWWFLEAGADFPTWELSPATAVLESLIQADRWPIVSDPPAQLLAAWANSEAYVRETGRKYIDVETLDRIWEQAGSPLLVIRGDGPAQPNDFLAPWDPTTGAPDDIAFGDTVAQARERLEELHRQQQAQERGAGTQK